MGLLFLWFCFVFSQELFSLLFNIALQVFLCFLCFYSSSCSVFFLLEIRSFSGEKSFCLVFVLRQESVFVSSKCSLGSKGVWRESETKYMFQDEAWCHVYNEQKRDNENRERGRKGKESINGLRNRIRWTLVYDDNNMTTQGIFFLLQWLSFSWWVGQEMKSFRRSPVDEDNRQNHTANDIKRVREKILPGIITSFLWAKYCLDCRWWREMLSINRKELRKSKNSHDMTKNR